MPENLPDCKFQKTRSLRSDGVERPDFGSESSGGQSFGFWYLLYATSRSFWSKNFDWTVLEAQKELCVWIGFPQRSLGFLLLFGLWMLAECYQKCSVRLYYGFLSARINEYVINLENIERTLVQMTASPPGVPCGPGSSILIWM